MALNSLTGACSCSPGGLLGAALLVPLTGAVLVSQFGRFGKRGVLGCGWFATAASLLSFLVFVKLFLTLGAVKGGILSQAWTWFDVAQLKVSFSLRLDELSAVMSLVVTGVGTLIHLFAIGYMRDDPGRPRFFAYLNLFLFCMLLLVLSDNLLVMFVGWEGVGLCSYLLIGFWFSKMENAKAGQKAFVVNRIGDAGFLLGMFLLLLSAGTLDFVGLESAVSYLPQHTIEVAALLLLIGAFGKSAQLPLSIWLPDAMAGPTPVSALIHAATMVTAGVYMVTRMSFLYVGAENVLLIISCVGAGTAFMAATIALVQNDIKKVLAYSTISQLGYMFMALGAGAFSAGMYHVVTHAFFKAGLFLAAGSVIIGCHHEQDMRKFGALWKKMGFTFAAYLVGTLAIAGVPPLSGFYSKDTVLWSVYNNPGIPARVSIMGVQLSHILWCVGVLTAFLTAVYMTRSFVMTFLGKIYRGHGVVKESPWTMTLPLVVLLVFSAGFAHFFGDALMHLLSSWKGEWMAVGHEALAKNPKYHTLEMISAVVAISGILVGLAVYLWIKLVPGVLVRGFVATHGFLVDKWRLDELYEAVVVCPLRAVASFCFLGIDRTLIDGFVNGLGAAVLSVGRGVQRIQAGSVQGYACVMLAGAVVVMFYWIFVSY